MKLILRWGLLAVCLAATLAGAQDRQAEVDALAAKGDPLADDWRTEILHAHAKRQLDRLGEIVTAYMTSADAIDPAIDGILEPGSGGSCSLIRTITQNAGTSPFYVRRHEGGRHVEPEIAPAETLVRWLSQLRPAKSVRIAFDVVEVQRVDKDRFDTTVLVQLSGESKDGPFQHNVRWHAGWRSTDKPERPRIASLIVEASDVVKTSQYKFTECTHSVVADDAEWRQQLLRGGEYWYGKMDAVGELNFLGHNGMAVGDVNGDGLEDVYVAMGNGLPNKLYVQQANGTTVNTAHEAGVAWLDDTKGVLLVDIDNDGDQDLLCAMGPTIVLCQNDGAGRFTPVRKLRAATDAAFYSLAAADYDLDGDLDIYAVRYVKSRYGASVPMPFHDATNGPPNHLLRNDGAEGFKDVTYDVGLNKNNDRFSLSISWSDYDRDGDPDLYVANDFGRNNLYRNDDGVFTDVAAASGVEDQAAGMGVSWADYDGDGDFDLYVSNMFSSAGQRIADQPRFKQGNDALRGEIRHHSLGNSLLRQDADGRFADASTAAGVRGSGWSWGAEFVDIDNDGYEDIVVPNGFLTNKRADDLNGFFWRSVASRSPAKSSETREYVNGWAATTQLMEAGASWSGHERNCAFLNLRDGTFVDASAVTGLDLPDDGRAMSVVDWDGDGDLDIWFRNRTGPQLRVMRNNGYGAHHFVAFKLVGKTCNRDAVGAVVEVHLGQERLIRAVSAGSGYLAQSSKWVHFGLGVRDRVDRIVVYWPGAERQELSGVDVDRRYRLVQGESLTPVASRDVELKPSPAALPSRESAARIVLREPVPLPPSLSGTLGGSAKIDRAMLINLWTQSSPTCQAELVEFAKAYDRIHASGLDIIALTFDKPADVQKAAVFFDERVLSAASKDGLSAGPPSESMRTALEAIIRHIVAKPGEVSLPASLLVDKNGAVQVIYLGPVSVDRVLADAGEFGLRSVPTHKRGMFPGRWYYYTGRSFEALARVLNAKGQREDALFYVKLDRERRNRP